MEKMEPIEAQPQTNRVIEIQFVRGFPFPGTKRFPRDNVESALAYDPKEGDIFIATYPKSGTTWVQYIIYDILHGAEMPLPSLEEIERLMPFMEPMGAEAAMHLNPPRVLKYHVPYYLVPQSSVCKYISVFRNPYDVVVSYFHFLRRIAGLCQQFDEFLDSFLSGDMVYGSYFDHVLSWYEHRDDPNVLLLSYDKMAVDPKKGLLKIAKFLGDEHFNRLSNDEVLVKKILERTSFNFMKKHLSVSYKEGKKNEDDSSEKTRTGIDPKTFFRKGNVGDYRNHLTEDQAEKIKMWIAEKSAGTEIEKFWQV